MERKPRRIVNCILAASLAVCLTVSVKDTEMTASATSVSELENQISAHQKELEEITGKIDELAEAQELALEKIDDLNAEIVNTMTSIEMKQEEIAEKDSELADKQREIDRTMEEYEAAKALEAKQHDDMVARVRNLYKQGEHSYMSLLLGGSSFSDALNRMDFAEKIYEYDKNKLEEYEATKAQANELWNFLDSEMAQLEVDKDHLANDKAVLEDLKGRLDVSLEKKKKESANYEAELKKMKNSAAVAKQQLQQEQNQLKQLKDAQNKPTAAAASGNYATTDYTSVIDNASGSDMGKNVAKYACQYIGNPYVLGGTSLTNGADCSGFTFRVYSDFGYRLPRTSYEQRSAGTGVSYDEAQPGDLICYEGHVALYIGDGLIVHASSRTTGIKISRATYNTILAVRRIL
ncbi:MAG: NlpC/P60 family protein [Bacteroidales bacterium]|nr:NlpC/P60 family protein [Lachnoclostridium sp.]MCM1383988.1 NlpC/P60 family protein [Lachnoclostridium sp.]MCM1464697.1 NlpC/P60 family protein [Bacteroidales bacterium]